MWTNTTNAYFVLQVLSTAVFFENTTIQKDLSFI